MKIFIAIFLSSLHFSSFSQSNSDIDKKIDSLINLRSENLTDEEKLQLGSQILKLKKIKYAVKSEMPVFPNLDSIHVERLKTVEKLWAISKLKTTTSAQKELLYAALTTYKEGMDLLVENIDFYSYDYDELSSDGLSHYPVFLFLHQTNASILYDYIKEKICDDSYVDQLFLLLSTTIDNGLKKNINVVILESYLDIECIGPQQKQIVKSLLELIK